MALLVFVLSALPGGFARAEEGRDAVVAVEDRVDAARACVAGLTATGEWEYDSPYAVEWISRERWCREPRGGGDDTAALPCEGGATDLLGLRLEHEREDLTVMQRMALNLALDPAGEAWDVHFYGSVIRLEPGSTLGEGSYALTTISVTRSVPEGEAEALSLTQFSFQIGDRVVMNPGEYLPPEELHDRFRTPEDLLDASLEQLDSLEMHVIGLLDRRQLTLCPEPDAPGRYQHGPMAGGEGRAVYDTCRRRGLTEAEIVETRARLHAEIEVQRVLVSQEYRAIHSAVTAAMPDDACWLMIEP